MRIWHQSFTDLDRMPLYRDTLGRHAARVVGRDTTVVLHGLRPGTYADGFAPIDAIRYRYLESLNESQVCEAALAAEREGYGALAIGCFFDPALRAARSLVDIPVLGLAESTMLVACSLGRRFGIVTLCDDETVNLEDLAAAYGLERRLAAVVSMEPPIDEYTLEAGDPIAADVEAGFGRAARRAMEAGAEVLIPGDGVLNEFLIRRGCTAVDGATVMDAIGVLFAYAELMASARVSMGLQVSRRHFYARPPDSMLAHARTFHGVAGLGEADFSGPERRGERG
jgi:Asp/Glu/hydantoin racemase